MGGFTRESAIAAVMGQDMTLLVKDPNWISVQVQQSGAGAGPGPGQQASPGGNPGGTEPLKAKAPATPSTPKPGGAAK